MKKLIGLLFICAFILAGCASTSETSKNQDAEKLSGEPQVEEVKKEVPPKYDDWKYKGFGTELPEWFEGALQNDAALVKEMLELNEDSSIIIICSNGKDVDQCEQKLNESAGGLSLKDYKLYKSCWARLNEETNLNQDLYISARVYTLKD